MTTSTSATAWVNLTARTVNAMTGLMERMEEQRHASRRSSVSASPPKRGHARGAELLVRWDAARPLSGWLSYPLAHVTDRLDGRDVPSDWDQRQAQRSARPTMEPRDASSSDRSRSHRSLIFADQNLPERVWNTSL
jgi:hypothetical protein